MILFDVITMVLLSLLLFWAMYNASIIYMGIRSKHKEIPLQVVVTEDLPKISLIVPTKNEELVIKRCLEGILNLDYPKDKLEVVVVDGNSSDGTFQICSEYSKNHPSLIKLLTEKKSKGKPAALNLALSVTTGEIVGLFDADSLPKQDALNRVVSYFNDKKIVAIQGRTTSLNEKSNALTRVIAIEEKAWFQLLLSGRDKLQLFIPLNGSCQFVKRSVLMDVGGWDENSLTEDVELAVRLVEKNYTIKYAPDVCSGQETPNRLSSLFEQRMRWYRGYMETALKYGRLLDKLNRRTVDAEISLGGPFMMLVSLISYLNWFFVALFILGPTPLMDFTGMVIALTAVSLVSIGIALTASEKPIKLGNIVWIPTIYFYWLMQMFIAGWAFLNLLCRRKKVWTKTAKIGFSKDNISTTDLIEGNFKRIRFHTKKDVLFGPSKKKSQI
jgi:cellulose synthase/poly-beta-1,6-N-acetylglucosamine synthase-like glycosyltransferase